MFSLVGNKVRLWRSSVSWVDERGNHEEFFISSDEAKAFCAGILEESGIEYTIGDVDQADNEWIEGKEYPTREIAETALAAGYDNYTSLEEIQDVASIMFVLSAEEGRLDPVTIAEHPSLFPRWTPEWTGKAGTILFDEGALYKSIHDIGPGQNTKPSETPAMWTRVADPTEEWPQWVQPIGAHDAYPIGAKCRDGGRKWLNSMEANVYRPGSAPPHDGWVDQGLYEEGEA